MKSCKDCKWADWKKTAAGKLHPSGDGRCMFVVKIPVLPKAFYWGHGYSNRDPGPHGGYIDRRREFDDHCPTYAHKDSA